MKNALTVAGTSARQATLEQVFEVVDQIKADLNRATSVWAEGNYLMNLYADAKSISWRVMDGVLMRNNVAMIAAKEFFVNHFPEANSVLYRIGMENGEQIRGYIFLMNVVK